MPRRVLITLFAVCILLAPIRGSLGEDAQTPKPTLLEAPAGRWPVKINPRGMTVLPNGRLITPFGKHVKVAPHPYGLVLSPDGKTLVTVNGGTNPFSASIITDIFGLAPHVAQIPPGFKSSDADPQSVFLGAAIARDNRTLYLSEGNNGNVGIFDLVSHQRLGSLSLDGDFQGKKYANSLSGELVLSRDSKALYVLDLAHFRLVVFDTPQQADDLKPPRRPHAFWPGALPRRQAGLCLQRWNVQLQPRSELRPKEPTRHRPHIPGLWISLKEAETGATVEGKAIAGLGDPNVPESNSLYVIDVKNPHAPQVLDRIRTGLPIGDQVIGGSSPGAVVAGKEKIFVSNATQDSITMIDARSGKLEQNALISPATEVKGLRGVLPFGMALSSNEKRLYVACAGINAVAVVETGQMQLLGFIPTGWFPSRVALSADNKTLFVANAKGFGAGPNGGKGVQLGPEGAYIGDITKGTVSILTVPKDYQLRPFTLQVMRNNGFVPGFLAQGTKPAPQRPPDFPIPLPGSPSSKIHHVVFITKENRTFDEVLGDLGGAAWMAMPRWPAGGWTPTVKEEKVPAPTLEHMQVTPNQHALAKRFAFERQLLRGFGCLRGRPPLAGGQLPQRTPRVGLARRLWRRICTSSRTRTPRGGSTLAASSTIPETTWRTAPCGKTWPALTSTFRNYGEGLELPGDGRERG